MHTIMHKDTFVQINIKLTGAQNAQQDTRCFGIKSTPLDLMTVSYYTNFPYQFDKVVS